MLEIHELQDISKYRDIITLQSCIPESAELRVIESHGKMKMITGFAIFSYDADTVNIYYCDYGDDIELCDGLLRTIMFKASMKGLDNAKCMAESENENLFCKMRYTKDNNATVTSIATLMNGCKKCKEIN